MNLNNREPLIAPDYDLPMLLALSERVEELGFDSVWVGDSLFSKPRWAPIALLSANLVDELMRIDLFNLGIFQIGLDKTEANSDRVTIVKAALYCERMELHVGGAPKERIRTARAAATRRRSRRR